MTEEALRKQIIEKLDDNVFVEAGAGAGKTTLIVSRIVNQLRQGIAPESIVVITFTNAAAEELRTRITGKVMEAGTDTSLTEKERANLQTALRRLDLMNISTIHSFCFKLLQERSFDAAIPMDIRLIEEGEAAVLYSKYFTEWAGGLSNTEWQKILSCGEDKFTALSRIKNLFLSICELPDDTNIAYDPTVLRRNYRQEAKRLVEDFEQVFCQAASIVKKSTFTHITEVPDQNLRSLAAKMKKLMAKPEIPYLEVLEIIGSPFQGKTTKYLKATKKELPAGVSLEDEDQKCRDWYEKVNFNTVDELLTAFREYSNVLLLEYAIQAREYYRKNRSVHYVTNDDLLQKTHHLICSSQTAREYFAGKIKCLYVDEFQDTDHIQEEFIWKLAALEKDDTKLRDGVLFLVGDPKQSIYRFRGAEPEVYFTTKEKMQKLENAAVYCLNYNFRSNDKIIDWVNRKFSGRNLCGAENYQNMVPQKKSFVGAGNNLLQGIYTWKAPEGQNSSMQEDAENVRDLILKLMQGNYQIAEYARDGSVTRRRLQYSDFLVLCNKKKNMDYYMMLMMQSGIPVQINGELSLQNNRALVSFARIYDALVHSYDRAKVVGAQEALKENGEEQPEEALTRLRESVQGMTAVGIAGYLSRRFDVLLPGDTDISEMQFLSVQTKLEQMLERVLYDASANSEFLAESFWNYIEKPLEREMSLEENSNSVRFMNLHKAKGLEGNIVILAKRDEKMNFHMGAFRKGKEYYPALGNSFGKTLWASYALRPDVYAEAEQEETQEQTRLQYVAATRAKQVLVVMDSLSEGSMFTGFELESDKEVQSMAKLLENDRIAVTQSVVYREFTVKEQKVEPALTKNGRTQEAAVYHSYSPSDFEKPSAIRQEARKRNAGSEEASGGKTEAKKTLARPKGNIFGTTMHRSLQLLIERWRRDFTEDVQKLEPVLKGCVAQAIMENRQEIPEAELPAYKGFLEEVLRSFAGWAWEKQLFWQAKAVYTEMPFSFYEESMKIEDELLPVWLNGTADLIVQTAQDEFYVLDYKSDHDEYLSEEEFEASLLEKYSGQLAFYRYAICKLFDTSQDMVHLGIISFTCKNGIGVRFTTM